VRYAHALIGCRLRPQPTLTRALNGAAREPVSVLVFVSAWRQAACGVREAASVSRRIHSPAPRLPAPRLPSTDSNTSTDTGSRAAYRRITPEFPDKL